MALTTQGRKPSKRRPQTDIDEGLDMISTGLLMLEQSDLDRVAGKKGIDITAKMNAQFNQLSAMLEPRKARIKAENLEDKPTTYARGFFYKAVIRRYPKAFPNFDLIKKLLGTRWSACQETKQITEVSFEVQE